MTTSPSKITATLTARPGKAEALRALLIDMAPHCRAEPGNLRWDIWSDPATEGRYVLDELYRDANAVEAHRNSPHYQNYLTAVPALADRTALVLEPLDIA